MANKRRSKKRLIGEISPEEEDSIQKKHFSRLSETENQLKRLKMNDGTIYDKKSRFSPLKPIMTGG